MRDLFDFDHDEATRIFDLRTTSVFKPNMTIDEFTDAFIGSLPPEIRERWAEDGRIVGKQMVLSQLESRYTELIISNAPAGRNDGLQ